MARADWRIRPSHGRNLSSCREPIGAVALASVVANANRQAPHHMRIHQMGIRELLGTGAGNGARMEPLRRRVTPTTPPFVEALFRPRVTGDT